MPKESLPFSNTQKQPAEAVQAKDPSPNLLDTTLYKQSAFDIKNLSTYSILPWVKASILLMQLLFFALWGINLLEDVKIKNLNTKIKELTVAAEYQKSIERETQATLEKTRLYQQIQGARTFLHPEVALSLEATPSGIEVITLDIIKKTGVLNINVESPLSLVQLISKYFTSTSVDSVTIKGARLNATKDIFNVDLEIWFK